MKKIKLTQGKYALVDDEDFERINQYKWFAAKRPTGINKYVAVRTCNNSKLYMHRVITNTTNPKIDVDHIDMDTLNNQKSNLRQCSRSQNMGNTNMRVDNTSGYKGVFLNKRTNKFRAAIKYKQKTIHIGNFIIIELAAKAYNAKALELHGEFARLNIIP